MTCRVPRNALGMETTTYPLEIWTIDSYLANGYTASSWCHGCHAWKESPDLARLKADGHGPQPLRDLKRRCSDCGRLLDHTIHPSPGFAHGIEEP